MHSPTFAKQIAAILNTLAEAAEDKGYDADLEGGVLTIATPAGQYLLNRHEPTAQLWLSSPRSGAHHFALQDTAWMETRTGASLSAILQDELGLVW